MKHFGISGGWSRIIRALIVASSYFLIWNPTVANAVLFRNALFSIELPSGWEEIPQSIIAYQVEAAAKATGSSEVQQYLCGYQESGGANWFEWPYLLIQEDHSGKMSRDEFRSMAQLSLGHAIEEAGKGAADAGLLTNLEFGKSFYDARRNVIWTRGRSEVGGTPIEAFTAMVQTNSGFIAVYGYVDAANAMGFETSFERIVDSIEFAPAVVFTPKTTDAISSQFRQRMPRFIRGAVIGALGGALWWFIRRPRKAKIT